MSEDLANLGISRGRVDTLHNVVADPRGLLEGAYQHLTKPRHIAAVEDVGHRQVSVAHQLLVVVLGHRLGLSAASRRDRRGDSKVEIASVSLQARGPAGWRDY